MLAGVVSGIYPMVTIVATLPPVSDCQADMSTDSPFVRTNFHSFEVTSGLGQASSSSCCLRDIARELRDRHRQQFYTENELPSSQ